MTHLESSEPPDRERPRVRHLERLSSPWWLWGGAAVFAGLVAAEIYIGHGAVAVWIAYGLVVALLVAGLRWLGRVQVSVVDDELRVDDARLPVRFVAAATSLDGPAKRDLLGPYADPLAFVVQRPWIPGAVQVHLADPADPTPYWLVSSRRPGALTAAILAARGASQESTDH